MHHNLYHQIAESGRKYGDRTALETESGELYTYAEFDLWTAKYAAWLTASGIVPGERILVQAEKSAPVLLLCYACIRIGAIFVPISAGCRRHEIATFLEDTTPSMVICDPRRAAIYESFRLAMSPSYKIFTLTRNGGGTAFESARGAEPHTTIAAINQNAPAALMYTSGTTGRPKAAVITHKNIIANGNALRAFWRWSQSEVLLHTLPLYHLHGLFVATVPSLFAGSKIILHRRFTGAATVAAMSRATVFMGVPTYFERLLASPLLTNERCSNVRLFISGSAPLRRQTFLSFKERTGHEILERYGMTESGGVVCNPAETPRMFGSIGIPLPGITLRVVDETGDDLTEGAVGEIQIHGESVFVGYWNRREETAAVFTADGYLRSGDLGRRLADGSYEIVGRAKDIIISNGENINPLEVEAALDACPGVGESAVVGIPDAIIGEKVVAVVVPEVPHAMQGSSFSINDLYSRLKRELTHYKLPRRIVLRNSLPRNSMGKVQKNILKSDPELLAAVDESGS